MTLIPTTVPKRPINGEVDEIIANQDTPLLASFIIFISQACKISFEAVPFEHCVKSESGENFDWLVVKISKDLFSFAINRFNALFL